MMNPFISYTQSFNESMTKDDREDAERRMATARPITAGIASPAAIAQSKMTKDDREDAERRMSMQATLTSRQIVPSAKLSADAPVAQSPYPSTGYGGPSGSGYVQPTAKPINAGIASPAAIAQSNKSKEDREISNAYKTPGYVQPVYPSQIRQPAAYTSTPTGMTSSPVIIPGTKDAREAAPDWAKLALQIGAAYLLLS